MNKGILKLICLISLGSSVELYDFFIFAVFSKTIGQTFFHVDNPKYATVLGLIVFIIGYVARPLGGLIVGAYADKRGRKNAYIIVVLVMGISTLLMALIPSFKSIGYFAPTIFICLRIIQGLALGGEVPSVITYVYEQSFKKSGFYCGLLFCLNNTGILVANIVHGQLALNWRVAFVVGSILALASGLLRYILKESAAFNQLQYKSKHPILQVIKEYHYLVIAGIFITALGASIVSVLFIALPLYLKTLNVYASNDISLFSTLSTIVYIISMAIFGWLGDKIGSLNLLVIGSFIFLVGIYPFYWCVSYSIINLYVMGVILGVSSGCITGIFPSILASLFETKIRCTGVSLSFNLSYVLFSGLIALLAMFVYPPVIIIITSLLTILGVLMISLLQRLTV